MTEQLQFAFASLDFPGRVTLYPHEIAEKLGMSVDQVHDLVDDGSLVAVNIASSGAARRALRIPVEAYRNFILERITGPLRVEFLCGLPEATRRDLVRELLATLPAPIRRELGVSR